MKTEVNVLLSAGSAVSRYYSSPGQIGVLVVLNRYRVDKKYDNILLTVGEETN